MKQRTAAGRFTFLCPLFLLGVLLLLICCNKQKPADTVNGAFKKERKSDGPNVSRIVDSGELIVATISGPDTYFEYQGRGFGLQYALAANFAETLGVGVRVEMCQDTLQLVQMLKGGDVDVVALQVPQHSRFTQGLTQAGATTQGKQGDATSWLVRSDAADLADALDDWFGDGVEVSVEKLERKNMQQRLEVRRKVRSPYISREKGIISTYDRYFKEAATAVGWDWRLIAAQCYQESGFDPNAQSWAGASGLMQIMPATAAQYSLPRELIFHPAENVATAARILRHLQGTFSSIADPAERLKFVLASYNAGPGHIFDAQALARKYGKNPQSWDDVGEFVRGLSQPRYYRDPVVKHGYMIGNETYNYVYSILDRWAQYGGSPAAARYAPSRALPAADGSAARSARPVHKPNKYSQEQHILTPEEMAR